MAPHIPSADVTLTYPIYASDFDPSNDDNLFVGGGGGEGRSGVENKITLIDTAPQSKLQELASINLSRDEDSVTSLAVARSTKTSVTVFAGINSSTKEQESGVNEHLRAFRVDYPENRDSSSGQEKEGGLSQLLAKVSLFDSAAGKQNETYQRVLRLSPPREGATRVGAIATGLAPLGEVVVFDTSNDTPSKADVRQSDVRRRIKLQKGEEAADVDLLPGEGDEFELVYCTDYDVCICTVASIGKDKNAPPTTLYTTPHANASKSSKRPTFRAVRFLSRTLLALISNLPGRTGTEVLLMHIPEARGQGGKILIRKRLHRNIKAATSFATAFLPGATPGQNAQHVLAVGGQDISITILTLDHSPKSNKASAFKVFTVLRDVHPVQMTSLAFSYFTPPKNAKTAPPQRLKLASTSMGSSVFVHSLPLSTYSPSSKEPARYCLSTPGAGGEVGRIGFSILLTMVMAVIGGVLIQALTEIRGGSPEFLGAKNWLSQSLREKIAVPYMFGENPVMVSSMPPLESMRAKAAGKVSMAQSVLSEHRSSASSVASIATAMPEIIQQAIIDRHDPDTESKPLILKDGDDGISAEHHHDEGILEKQGKRWEDLEHHEKKAWRKKLAKAGEWTEGQLETVLKGVFFGELGGVVAGVLNG